MSNNRCIKCDALLGSRSDDKKEIGLCGRCFNKKECIKCGKRLGSDSGDDLNKSLCHHCK